MSFLERFAACEAFSTAVKTSKLTQLTDPILTAEIQKSCILVNSVRAEHLENIGSEEPSEIMYNSKYSTTASTILFT